MDREELEKLVARQQREILQHKITVKVLEEELSETVGEKIKLKKQLYLMKLNEDGDTDDDEEES